MSKVARSLGQYENVPRVFVSYLFQLVHILQPKCGVEEGQEGVDELELERRRF